MGEHDILLGRGVHNKSVFGRVGTNIMFKKYNINNHKHSFTILYKVEGLTPDNLHSSAYARGVVQASMCERDDAKKQGQSSHL